MYTYRAHVIKVYDGDTITCVVDLGFKIKHEITVRLADINTPEIRGEERELGLMSRDALRAMILDKDIVLETIKDKTGKYGRYIGIVFLPNENINESIVSSSDSGFININDWLVENEYAQRKIY